MLKNRSAPMSAPKPASVIRKSPVWMPIRSPTTEELPCAMLPNGPAWTIAGVFSRVCSRFGLIASRMITVIAPAGLEFLGGDRLACRRVADHDPAEPGAHVVQRGRQREHRHHLRCRRDVEPGLPGHAVRCGAEPEHDVAQGPVVDVEHPLPGDVVRVDAQLVALVEVVVDHRRQHVVGRGDRVHVAGQVQVQGLERDHLAVPAAGGAALDPERRAHRRLPDARSWLACRCAASPGRGRPWWWSCPRRAASG